MIYEIYYVPISTDLKCIDICDKVLVRLLVSRCIIIYSKYKLLYCYASAHTL